MVHVANTTLDHHVWWTVNVPKSIQCLSWLTQKQVKMDIQVIAAENQMRVDFRPQLDRIWTWLVYSMMKMMK